MRKLPLLTLLISSSVSLSAQTSKSIGQPLEKTAVALVQQQLDAYNARNIDAFMVPFSDSLECYTFPNEPRGKGKESLRKGMSDFLSKVPDLHCEITGRIVKGNMVVDKEHITGMNGNMVMEAIVIYEIEGEKIKKVYLIQ